MKKIILYLAVFLVFCGCENLHTPGPEPPDYTEINGKLSGKLTKADSPYLILETIFIDSLDKLIIDPDVKLFFTDSANFIIRGELLSVGQKYEEILFTSFKNTWKGIRILNSRRNSQIQFCMIENVRIDDTDNFDYGAIEVNNSSVNISNCIIQNNYSTQGGGITIINSDIILTNNIFQKNTAVAFGGAVLSVASITEIINNTFYKNFSHNHGGGVVLIYPLDDDVQNNIFYQNMSSVGNTGLSVASNDTSGFSAKYNFPDQQNSDPKFLSENDLHLSSASPCINSGNPDPKFNDVDGSRNDTGAFGGPKGDW